MRILDDLSSGRREYAPPEAELQIGGRRWLLHLAAIASIKRCHIAWRSSHDVNLGGTINVLDACRGGRGNARKHPILKGRQHQATTDATPIDRWWRRWPKANIAVATGMASGFFALDIDGKDEHALVELERRHGALPDLYPMQSTGGGRAGRLASLPGMTSGPHNPQQRRPAWTELLDTGAMAAVSWCRPA